MKLLNKLEQSILLQALSLYIAFIDGQLSIRPHNGNDTGEKESNKELWLKQRKLINQTMVEAGFNKELIYNITKKLENADLFTI